MTYPNVSGKWAEPSLTTPAQFIDGARAAGWDPGAIPETAVFTFDHRATAYIDALEAAEEAPELAPGNARVFRFGSGIVSCLSPGAGAMATQMQNLAYMGTRQFMIIGTAGGITDSVDPGDTIVVTKAVRDDGLSQHFAEPQRYAEPSPTLTSRLAGQLPNAKRGTTWTVPVPFRMTKREIETYAAEGVVAVEMEVAPLFTVADYLGADSAAALVITSVTTATVSREGWPASMEPLHRAMDAALALL